jgi:Tol biopolymer transport system component
MNITSLPRSRRAWVSAFAVASILGGSLLASGTALATVSGSNGLIAVVADTGIGSQLYTIRPDGTGLRQLTDRPGENFYHPDWQPGTARMVVERDLPDGTAYVALVNDDGSNLLTFPHTDGDAQEGEPAFSPDGQHIYYEAYDGHRNDQIWSMRTDGTNRHRISSCEGRGATAPNASPDGRHLAFMCTDRTGAALFVSDVDGTHLHRVAPYALNVGFKLDWSPDSSHIMFLAQQNDADNIVTVRPDGTDLTWLTNYPPGGPRAFGNSYSPDGSKIVLRIESGDQNALFTINPDGTHLTQATAFSAFRPRFMAWGSATS